MKRPFLLALTAVAALGCDSQLTKPEEAITPTPAPTPVAKATPKPGDWMWKDYKNPLDSKTKR